MAIHGTIEFITGDQGRFVSNQEMIVVVQGYIYQEKGIRVNIADPGFNTRQKALLLKAYSWAVDHLQY